MDAATRRRILDASVVLIETEGLAALSMREVARRAGVSHQAPYHYFAGREAILAAIAEEGFEGMAAALKPVQSAPSVEARLVESGIAYVRFALEHPAHFRLMFRPELVELPKFPEAQRAAEVAFAELEQMVAAVRPALRKRVPTRLLTTLHWSLVHGLAELLLENSLKPHTLGLEGKLERARETLTAHARLILAQKRPGGASGRAI